MVPLPKPGAPDPSFHPLCHCVGPANVGGIPATVCSPGLPPGAACSEGDRPVAQQRITFEWVLEDNRAELWHGQGDGIDFALGLGLAAGERRLVRNLGRGITLLLAALILATSVGLSPVERERRIAERGITAVLNLENSAWRMRDYTLYAGLLDPTLDERWVAEWRDHWRTGADSGAGYTAKLINVRADAGLMRATLLVEQPTLLWWQTSPYVETRFYRRLDDRWVRTMPSADYWGEPRALRTEHLRLTYFARDADAVEAAAPQLERAYVGMYTTLGLEPPPAWETLTIAVVPQPVGRWTSSPNDIEVMSPSLTQVPAGQSYADYLAYDVMGWFTYRAVRDAAPGMNGRYLYRWPIVVWGLRGWLRDDLLAQPTPWQGDVLAAVQAHRDDFLPARLSEIADLRANINPARDEVILRYLAAESFVRFAAETYGRERLPDLLDALVRYGKWDEIIPQVYGVSAKRFEADWNAFLIEYYGLK